MYEAGLRRAEVVSLNVYDIDMERYQLRVVGKGNKERYVPFQSTAIFIVLCRNGLRFRQQSSHMDKPALFCTNNPCQALTYQRSFNTGTERFL